jgi:hypothetical protein
MWYKISIKLPYLQDQDYKDFVVSRLFNYTDVIDNSLIEYNILEIDVLEEDLKIILSENDFIQQARHSGDRDMLIHRTFLKKEK